VSNFTGRKRHRVAANKRAKHSEEHSMSMSSNSNGNHFPQFWSSNVSQGSMVHKFDAINLSDHQPQLMLGGTSFCSPNRGTGNIKGKGPCAVVKEAVSKLPGAKGTRDEIIEQAQTMST
jgi:hypothetical protein